MKLTPSKAPGIALVITSLFFLYGFVTSIEPSIATDQISADLDLSAAELGFFSSLFFWVYAPMQLVVGLVLDHYGLRRFLLAAILVCSLGVLIVASAGSALVAGIGRAMTGLGASFAFVSALYVANHSFSPDRFALLSGVINAIGMTGAAVGALAFRDVRHA